MTTPLASNWPSTGLTRSQHCTLCPFSPPAQDKVAHVPLAVVLFHWNGLDTSREGARSSLVGTSPRWTIVSDNRLLAPVLPAFFAEAILAEVDRNLAFCFGKDEAFVGRVDAWNYAIVHATVRCRRRRPVLSPLRAALISLSVPHTQVARRYCKTKRRKRREPCPPACV